MNFSNCLVDTLECVVAKRPGGQIGFWTVRVLTRLGQQIRNIMEGSVLRKVIVRRRHLPDILVVQVGGLLEVANCVIDLWLGGSRYLLMQGFLKRVIELGARFAEVANRMEIVGMRTGGSLRVNLIS